MNHQIHTHTFSSCNMSIKCLTENILRSSTRKILFSCKCAHSKNNIGKNSGNYWSFFPSAIFICSCPKKKKNFFDIFKMGKCLFNEDQIQEFVEKLLPTKTYRILHKIIEELPDKWHSFISNNCEYIKIKHKM